MPGLALGHLLGATVVVADLRHAVDDLFTVQLQDDAEGTVGGGVVRAEVEEHVVLVLAVAFHAPVFRAEARGFLFKLVLGQGQAEGVEFGGARRIVLAQRVTFPGVGHHDPRQVRMAGEGDAVHVPDFPLVPVGVGPDTGDGGQVEVALGQGDLDHYVTITLQRHQVVEHREVGARQAAALGAQALVDAMQVVQHDVGAREVAQELEDVDQLVAADPEHRHASAGRLEGEAFGAKAGIQLYDDVLVVSLVRRNGQNGVCSHGLGRYRST
ncbi:hypothetical protein D3C85_811930 [compost metagenome]